MKRILLKAPSTIERRTNPRITGPIPAVALDLTGSGKQLGDYLVLDNLSAGGFYLRLTQAVSAHDNIFVVTQISQAVVVIKGSPLRSQLQADGGYGLAYAIKQYQIFSLEMTHLPHDQQTLEKE